MNFQYLRNPKHKATVKLNSSYYDKINSNKKEKDKSTKTVKSIFKEGFLSSNETNNQKPKKETTSTQRPDSKSSNSSTSTNSSSSSNSSRKVKEDGPGPEPKYFKEFDGSRKTLIFNKKAIFDKKFITKFLLSNQEKLNKEYNSSKKSSFWKSTNQQIYDFVVIFKACMANYLLVLHLYNINNCKKEELQLFLFILKENKDKCDFINQKIEENIFKMQSSNRIAKYYPGLIKMFMEIISIFIKLSAKFYKTDFVNYFVKLYMKIILYILIAFTDVLNSNFVGETIDTDMKTSSRYFYASCLNNLAIFHFYKYQPLYISNKIFKHIFSLYEGLSSNDLLNIEQIFILTIHYNFGLLLHLDGNSIKSISQLKRASYIISQIKYATKIEKLPPKKLENEKKSSPRSPKIRSRNETQNNRNNTSTCFSGVVTSKGDDEEMQNVKNLLNNDSDNLLNIRNYSKISLNGKKIIILHDPVEFSISENQEYNKEKLLVQLELLLCDIELDQKNYNESFKHLNNIMSKFKKRYSRSVVPKTKSSIASNDIIFLNESLDKNMKSNSIVNLDISRMNEENFSLILSNEDINYINFLLEKNKKENNKKDVEVSIKHYDKPIINNNNNNKKEKNISNEIEKFFIFICGLSVYQLNLLNKSQPKKGNKRNGLPILFSNQFKDCLCNSQRCTLENLEALNLSRYIILNQPDEDICPENINFHYLYKLNENNDNEMKKKNDFNELRRSCPKKLKLQLKMKIDYNIDKQHEKNIEEGDNESESGSNGKCNEEENGISTDFLVLQNNCKNGDWEIFSRNKTKILKLLNNLKEKEKKLLIESPGWNEFLLKSLERKNEISKSNS